MKPITSDTADAIAETRNITASPCATASASEARMHAHTHTHTHTDRHTRVHARARAYDERLAQVVLLAELGIKVHRTHHTSKHEERQVGHHADK